MNDENTKGGFHLKKNEYFEKYGFWPPDNDVKKMNIELEKDEIYELYKLLKMEEFRKGFGFKNKKLLEKIIELKREIQNESI
ncbi:MAG: hypothetical protein AABY22_22860 [Nanoarchaeota archaeon]